MSGLETDLYEIRMAVSYLRRGMTAPATFSLFPRRLPADRGFLVAAGLADGLEFLAGFGFTGAELDWLRAEAGLRTGDLDALAALRFDGDVRAVPEGRLVAAGTPLVEVTASFPQAQLVETALLNFLTHQTAVATKAARCRLAAGPAGLIDFAARRTHGLAAARAAARATAIAGFAGTSFVASARELAIPALGTMAHSYVQAFGSDAAAFRAFAEDFPSEAVFLVDTFDTVAGVERAIEVARELDLPPERVRVRLVARSGAAGAADLTGAVIAGRAARPGRGRGRPGEPGPARSPGGETLTGCTAPGDQGARRRAEDGSCRARNHPHGPEIRRHAPRNRGPCSPAPSTLGHPGARGEPRTLAVSSQGSRR